MARVLLVGAGGFIGSAIARALIDDGHALVAQGRDLDHGRRVLPEAEWRFGDLRAMTAPASWAEHLRSVEIVINASGALQSGLRDDVTRVQHDAIVALAQAARAAGVTHFIQLSAAGAERGAPSDFMASKAAADAGVIASGLACTVLRPGLVIGRNAFGGTELLRTAAGLPWLSPEIAGTGAIQCVALADVVSAVRQSIAERITGSFDLVEEQAHTLGEVIAAHRRWLGFPAARWRPRVPLAALKPLTLAADLLGWLGWRSPLRRNAVASLAAGVRGNVDQARALLGREPLSLAQTLTALGPAGKADRWHARLALAWPLALASLVALWLVSGVLGLTRTGAASALLTAGGVGAGTARALVIGGSLADLAVAAGLLLRPWLKPALKASLALSLAYLAGSLLVRPDLWLDPLGPMLKVLPVLALTLACMAMADER